LSRTWSRSGNSRSKSAQAFARLRWIDRHSLGGTVSLTMRSSSLRNQASLVRGGKVPRTAAHCDSVKGAGVRILSMFHTPEYEERAPPRSAFRHSLPIRPADGARVGTQSTPNGCEHSSRRA
jgi:hypothetical protein